MIDVSFNPDFIARVIQKLDWNVVYNAAKSVNMCDDLPSELMENYENNNEFLKKAHRVLLEVDVISGDLVCPETGRKFPISEGVPNMLLKEDEV